MLSSLMPIEETGDTRVRTNCLNFDVSLCISIKNEFQFEEEVGMPDGRYFYCQKNECIV